jgi:hypothetical protein
MWSGIGITDALTLPQAPYCSNNMKPWWQMWWKLLLGWDVFGQARPSTSTGKTYKLYALIITIFTTPPRTLELYFWSFFRPQSFQTKCADLVLAYETAGGIHLGSQVEELFRLMDALGWKDGSVFRHAGGTPLISGYFRKTHLITLLEIQATVGDKILKQKVCLGEVPITLAERFYSIHSYRRGGRTMVAKHRPGDNRWEAFYAEVVEC